MSTGLILLTKERMEKSMPYISLNSCKRERRSHCWAKAVIGTRCWTLVSPCGRLCQDTQATGRLQHFHSCFPPQTTQRQWHKGTACQGNDIVQIQTRAALKSAYGRKRLGTERVSTDKPRDKKHREGVMYSLGCDLLVDTVRL